MKDELILIDTNILVYALDHFDKRKQKISEELLEKCWNGDVNYAVSIQNISEFFVIVTSKIANPQ